VVKDKLSGEEFEVDADDQQSVGQLTSAVRRELNRPEVDEGGPVTYRLVNTASGLLLDPSQTLAASGLKDGDTLSFWGEPTAAVGEAVLRAEFGKVLQRYQNHEHVSVEPILTPPREYRVIYRLRAPVGLLPGGAVKTATHHELRIRLGEDFPRSKPELTMTTPTWHPNIAHSGAVCIGDDYYMAQTLADVIAKVGNMLQYREYDLRSPYRRDVADWVRQRDQRIDPFDDVGLGG
jgi:hypothetical protein